MPRQVRLYNTLSRTIETLEPLEPGAVKLYCCGPTVYNYQHIGNLRTYIFEDILARSLRYAGYQLTHVMNITDVGHMTSDADSGEDKMSLASKREGKTSHEIADFYTKVFFEHCALLNIQPPKIVCKATDHIPQMINLIQRLENIGTAYQSAGNVYFDINKFSDYGKLARLDIDSLKAGARIEIDQHKRNAHDFALWFTKSKFSQQELQWDSPWGKGYPGWHIECSAMAMHYLGETIDIHCGGIDHIPIHHTNEIAQSEAATGKKFAQIWMHGGFLVVDSKKMSKSIDGFLTLDKLIDQGYDPISFRLLCLAGVYRQELSWSIEALDGAANTLRKIKNSVLDLKTQLDDPLIIKNVALSNLATEMLQAFDAAIFDDLGTAKALSIVYATLNETKALTAKERLNLLYRFDDVLGLGASCWEILEINIPDNILTLANQRETARKEKNWQEADRLRKEISNLGYLVTDTPDGPQVTQKS